MPVSILYVYILSVCVHIAKRNGMVCVLRLFHVQMATNITKQQTHTNPFSRQLHPFPVSPIMCLTLLVDRAQLIGPYPTPNRVETTISHHFVKKIAGFPHLPSLHQLFFRASKSQNHHPIPRLTEAVVMQLVVFHTPGLWQHPVEPVLQPSPERAQCEAAAAEAAAVVTAVVAPVAGVVAHHGPGTWEIRKIWRKKCEKVYGELCNRMVIMY